ncbi:MAG: hypothetical protein HY540_04225 [Deltaproteobacteria bacterium]|nr:hypothetical protein [Deltaproteobacteria bacterium]
MSKVAPLVKFVDQVLKGERAPPTSDELKKAITGQKLPARVDAYNRVAQRCGKITDPAGRANCSTLKKWLCDGVMGKKKCDGFGNPLGRADESTGTTQPNTGSLEPTGNGDFLPGLAVGPVGGENPLEATPKTIRNMGKE